LKPEKFGGAPVKNQFSAEEIARSNAQVSGWSPFVDCLGVCRFCVRDNSMTLESIGAVTGWEMDFEDAMRVGRRSMNLLRVFNLKHGLRRESERPSSRYGSTPVDGPAEGKGIMPVWDEVVKNYYSRIGWDPETGKPLPETLRSLGLDYLIQDLKAVP
jgi:aldehyde:ferredoxin oxidoreductase